MDNTQAVLSAVFIGTISSLESYEKCFQGGLWIFWGNWDKIEVAAKVV